MFAVVCGFNMCCQVSTPHLQSGGHCLLDKRICTSTYRAHTHIPDVQAKTVLVESYKQLRAGDAAPGSGSAYRITVRQLEALVRLSEAHARVRCDEWIRPRDVREVCLSIPTGQQGQVRAGQCVWAHPET